MMRTQKSLPCPNGPGHMMNLCGSDPSGHRHEYYCHQCPGQKIYHLWTGGTAVAGDQLTQVTLDAQPALGVLDAERDGLHGGPFRVGERVLVLVGTRRNGRAFARAVYRLPTPPVIQLRRYGQIDALTTPDYGWIVVQGTNERLFVHRNQTVGKVFRQGQRVSFVPALVPGRGLQATDVRAA